jgi:methylated-DNA-protein-cysteine methyltransferase related protein
VKGRHGPGRRGHARGGARGGGGDRGAGDRAGGDRADGDRGGPHGGPFARRVHAAVAAIPEGRVASYGAVARAAGAEGAARAVGRVLAALPDGADLPWWRVVDARGRITLPGWGGGASLQRALLAAEGVTFVDDGRADLDRHGWQHGEEP